MPSGNQSLQPWTLSANGAQLGTTYKGNIDGNSSVGAQTAGSLYVYPNSPVGMSVLVDPGFIIPSVGQTAPLYHNAGGAAVTVTLVAPGANSYYACIYWDLATATAGVVYGPSGVTPTEVFPDKLSQIPLALVLLATGQTTVVATNISDARSWIPEGPVNKDYGVISANQTLNCNGATEVLVAFAFASGFDIQITLTNLRIGVPVSIRMLNGSGANRFLKVAASTPGGVAYTVFGKTAAVAANYVDATVTGVSTNTGTTYLIWGTSYLASTGPTLMLPLL